MPVAEALGRRYGDDFILYRAISQDTPERMASRVAEYRAEGYRRFQLKVGSSRSRHRTSTPSPPSSKPATSWWRTPTPAGSHMAQCASSAPCATSTSTSSSLACLTKSAAPSASTDHPFVLDETIDGIDVLLRASALTAPWTSSTSKSASSAA
ncbi:MAG: hypothetical protein R2724_07145 [Bryobacterales bacterium]